MKKEKCLVEEAREKCKCEWCKFHKELRQQSLQAYASFLAHKIYYDSLNEALEAKKDEKLGKKKSRRWNPQVWRG